MPAFLQPFIEAEQERSRRIEQLRKEIREFAEEEAGSSITEQLSLIHIWNIPCSRTDRR